MDLAIARRLARDLIAGLEDCRLTAYPDPGSKDGTPWTIGYGHTRGVVKGMTCTKAQARAWLLADLEVAARALRAKIGAVMDELTDHQAAALLSFVFNLGTGDPRKREWTIWGRLRRREFDQVPLEFPKFVYNDGKKMQGLVNRRAEELKVWAVDEPGSVPDNPPSSVTRTTPTPPAPADPTPPQKSATVLTAALGVASAVPVAAKQVTDAVEPYRDTSPLVANVIAFIATVAAVAAVVVLVLGYLNKRKARS